MSRYSTLSSDYHELVLDRAGDVLEVYDYCHQPHIDEMAKEMCNSFNSAELEKYLDDDIQGKIKSIRMSRTRKVDEYGRPFFRITFEGNEGVRFTQKLIGRLDDYMSGQFSDGWGECFFYPNSFKTKDGTIIAVW
jgi:hypothetical protein